MLVLLDTNVILDAMLQRSPWNSEADAILALGENPPFDLAVSSLTVCNVFYIARRTVGSALARSFVQLLLKGFVILRVDRQTLAIAEEMAATDFEDNIQIAAAIRSSADAIVTRDASGFSMSTIPVYTPAQFLFQHGTTTH